MKKQYSEKKQKLIEDFKNSQFNVGDEIKIADEQLDIMYPEKNKYQDCKILEINNNKTIIVSYQYFRETKTKTLKIKNLNYKKNTLEIGANPFFEKYKDIRSVNFQLESIIYQLDLFYDDDREYHTKHSNKPIKRCCWNPVIIENGKPKTFQRDFVWTVEQEQRLIESIYMGVNCGSVLVRLRSWGELEELDKLGVEEIAFHDIIDGKQRMNAIRRFINNKFPDLHGNYYNDLSDLAQLKFGNHQLFQYAEIPENRTDEEILYQFLKMNHEGVPQSKKHLDYVADLLAKISK